MKANPNRQAIAVRLAAAGAATLTASAMLASVANAASPATISKFSVHRLAAGTANQVITVTGTGFDEDTINSVTIDACESGDPATPTNLTYVVSSATTLLVKTSTTCAVKDGAKMTITGPESGDTVTSVGTVDTLLNFVAAPKLRKPAADSRPVVTDYSDGRAYDKQHHTAATTGGTLIKVFADDAVPFVNTTAYPLSATINGVALKTVAMTAGGAFFTAVLPLLAASSAPILKVTSNGVSASFKYESQAGDTKNYTQNTHDFQIAGLAITVAPASGPVDGNTTVKVTGAGFTADSTVSIGGTDCPVTARTATTLTCTSPAVDTAGPQTVTTTTGAVTSVVGAGSTFTYLDE